MSRKRTKAKPAGNAPAGWSEKLRPPPEQPPEFPDLTAEGSDVRARMLAAVARMTPEGECVIDEDAGYVVAGVMLAFCEHVEHGTPIDGWVFKELASGLRAVLMGAAWEWVLPLPGRPSPPKPSPLHPLDMRDMRIFGRVRMFVEAGRGGVVQALHSAAAKEHVSYETAREAYYRWMEIVELRQ